MGFYHSVAALAALTLVVEARQLPFRHEAVGVNRRQDGSPASVSASATSYSSGVLAMITPSPGALPVAVTAQSQIVTSYVPQFTLCELPPLAFYSVSPMPSARPTTAPYQNYSISIPPGNGTCTTIYSETETMVCDTILTGLVTTYPVTNCAQEITFSSRYGYTLVTPTPTANLTGYGNYTLANGSVTSPASSAMITPAPTIETLTTYYLAPWQELTAGTAPSDVVKKICQTFANDTTECIAEYQVWHTSLITQIATSTISLNISTMITGPSQIIVWETLVGNVTEQVTTFALTTTMETEYQTEWTTTHHNSASVSTAPTVFQTLTVEEASSTAESTSTTTIRITSTRFTGTTTVMMPSATATST